jgi:hypothetical protein
MTTKKKTPPPPKKPQVEFHREGSIGPTAARQVSEHAQGFVFGVLVGLAFGVVGTVLTLWASMEPLVR